MYGIQITEVFDDWFTGLKDRMVKVRIQARIEDGNFGDSQPVGGGVSEMRLHFGAGWRVYYTVRGGEVVVLLAGGSKSNQQADIAAALSLAKQL
jgi:putative addiction module killer protein